MDKFDGSKDKLVIIFSPGVNMMDLESILVFIILWVTLGSIWKQILQTYILPSS